MLIDALSYTLERSGCVERFWGKLDAGQDATLGVAASARPFLVAARYAAAPQPTLVLVAGEEAAATFARNTAAYLGDEAVLHFPERSDRPYAPKPPDPRQVSQRLAAAHRLASGSPCVVVASARALLRTMPPPEAGLHHPLELVAGRELSAMPGASVLGLDSFEDAARALEERGYQNTGELDGPGTFAVQGGTIDVFPGNLSYPVRLDFFGDEIDEIRRIVPSTGQTIASLEAVDIFAVREYLATPEMRGRAVRALKRPARTNPALRELLEALEGGLHFDGADALLPYLYDQTVTLGAYGTESLLTCLIEPKSLFDDALHASEEIAKEAHGSNIALQGLFAEPARLDFGPGTRATYISLMRVGTEVDDELPVKRVEVAGHPDKLYDRLRGFVDGDFTIVFSAPHFRARQDMELAMVERGIPIQERLDIAAGEEPAHPQAARMDALKRQAAARISDEDEPRALRERRLKRGVVNVVDVEIPLGMIIPKASLAMISVSDTQGSSAHKPTRRIDITEVTFPYKPGDYVVHAAHGIAHFAGLVKQDTAGSTRDYMLLEYAEGDKLYVPVEQLDRVTRYVGPEGSEPRLTRLNTSDWSRAMSRARKATKKLAFDLVDVYARRAAVRGFRFSPDTPWQREMEEAFPYQETADQLAAIADIKADMQAGKPMDRLICGDVGFGKTEVALRAAFKATQDGKQVMVLCPTTILAQQHYISFKERCEPFGVRVEVLSRFRTPAQQRAALEGFADGSVDILVGTHRLLSRDVNPHDLGLIIIDEEQRFGVGHKEQLKNLRESVDVLTLSATPIPRTMQMSLSGVRDMSLIMTPPDERRPVEVHVGEFDPDIVSGAIRRELARGGQVYYVSNRVRSIDEAVARVQEAAGEARVGVAHGQMDKDQLERVMEEFAAGQLDVLVATTIIESGIDNPHTNTLIIEDSQRLGLAQLYQLKGRVGRSATQAYAYFMFPDNMPLTEEARERLMALSEHQDLGSGIRIALKDLEIRGAGTMLGAEQHGNMSAVGFDLFAQMLATAVNATREGNLKAADELPPALSDITVNLPGSTYLPEEYVPEADERVLWYRRIASASSPALVQQIYEELLEAHPDIPQEAENLFTKARIKAHAFEHRIGLVSVVGGKLVVEPIEIPRDVMATLRRAKATWTPDKKKLRLPLKYFGAEDDSQLMEGVLRLLNEIARGAAE